MPTLKPGIDYPELRKQLNDYKSTFYGPHQCEGCGVYDVIRKAHRQGGESWESSRSDPHVYIPHHCTHVLLFRKLAGKVLTILDASFSPESRQLKAIKDLMKKDFSSVIEEARNMEGNFSGESTESFEQLAEV